MSPAEAVLLFDGTCGMCASSVRFILRHERRHSLLFAPLAGTFAAAVRARHPHLERVDSLVWVEPGSQGTPETVCTRSAAVLRITRYLGGPWRAAGAAHVLPCQLRDAMYDLVARHRHRVFAPGSCQLPGPDVKERFLE